MKGFKNLAAILAALTISTATVFTFGCERKRENGSGGLEGSQGETVNDYLLDNPADDIEYFFRSETMNEVYTVNESGDLGSTYNAAVSPYLGVGVLQTGKTVFDEDFLQAKISKANHIRVSTSESKYFTADSIDGMAKSVSNGRGYDAFKNASQVTEEEIVNRIISYESCIDFKDYASKYFYYSSSNNICYTLSLPNYVLNVNSYADNLSAEYLNTLESVFGGETTYTQLFDKYGTHVIMKGFYGGKITICFSAASNKYDLSGKCGSVINTFMDSCMAGTAEAYDLPVIGRLLGGSSGTVNERLYISISGGTVPQMILIGNIKQALRDYFNTLENSPVLIGAADDGLVPLWKLLPEKYSSRSAEFEKAMNDYIAGRKK